MVIKNTKEEKTGRNSTTLYSEKKDFFPKCCCLPGFMLFWVDEAILESTLGRKKLRMRINCKGKTFFRQC